MTPPTDHDFRTFIIKSFGLKQSDTYIYRATAEVTLQQAQIYLSYGGQNRLHEWYRDEHGKQVRCIFVPWHCVTDKRSICGALI